jgi:DNA-binding CsgD family transcriptional regulator
LREALAALAGDDPASSDLLLWLGIGCWAAGAVGDDGALHVLATRFERTAREEAALLPLSRALLRLGMSEALDGSLANARACFAERASILAAIGRPVDAGTLLSYAWSGREADARAEAAAVLPYAAENAHGWILVFAEYALAVLELGLGNYRAAFEALKNTYRDDPFLSMVTFPSLIEAAMRCGERVVAVQALHDFSGTLLPDATPLVRALFARSAALVADDAHAELLYQSSIDQFRLSRGNLQLARAHLVYGEWLRRQQRRTDARDQLRLAHEMFQAMGAAAFATRARVELAATGERARTRSVDTANELTPQEAQIALLASQGATNSEIAAKLFLSPNTVDYHLRKVYRKLALTSRRQLARALPT